MRRLDFADGSFDLIWCEGAIYNVGVAEGLRDWRRLLPRGGHVALTEVCWRKPNPPPECAAFWDEEYPAIQDTAALLQTIDACGYRTAGHFPLPASAWWDDYYRPLQENLTAFRERHRGAPDAQDVANQCQRGDGHLACLPGVLRLRVLRAPNRLKRDDRAGGELSPALIDGITLEVYGCGRRHADRRVHRGCARPPDRSTPREGERGTSMRRRVEPLSTRWCLSAAPA